MSKNQDYSNDSSKQLILQLNNSDTLIMPVTHKHEMISNVFEPPLKKTKELSITMEKTITTINNNNSQNLKSACSATGYTSRNHIIAKNDSIGRKKKIVRVMSSVTCQTENLQLLSVYNLIKNAKATKFYTGLKDYDKFISVFNTLSSDKYDLRYYDNESPVNISHLDQFLIVLILLKQHKSHYELSIMFNITLKDIKNIFITWIRFMRLEWRNIKIKEEPKLNQTLSTSNSDRKTSNKVLQSSNQNCTKIIDIETVNSDPLDQLKKMYKILLNGPANYIESHLIDDIHFVCQKLYYLTTSNIVTPTTLKPPAKRIKLN